MHDYFKDAEILTIPIVQFMLFCNFEDYNNKEWFINYYYIHVLYVC